jgi:putative spermidine/putrescine transport system substrate-binding protein
MTRQALVALLIVLLCACGGEKSPAKAAGARDAAASSHAREGRLDLLAPAQTPAPGGEGSDWVRAFESETDCKVSLRTASSRRNLLELAAQDDADLVLASGNIAASLVAAGSVRPFAPTRVPALAQLDPRLRDLSGAVVDGRRYGLPWRWQPNVLAYDTGVFPERRRAGKYCSSLTRRPPRRARWLRPNRSRSPTPRSTSARTRPELRITDPFLLDERQYAATLALLRRQQASLRGTWRDEAAQLEGFSNGVVASTSTPAQVRALQGEGLPVAWTLPAEGGTAQVEIAMLHSALRHPNCAQAWMQWALTPKAQALLAARAGALPVVSAACQEPSLAGTDACARDGMALLPRVHFQRVPPARCGRGRCVPYSRWTRDYLALHGE